jgi:hypothetical protein
MEWTMKLSIWLTISYVCWALGTGMLGHAQGPGVPTGRDAKEFRIDTDIYTDESRPPIVSTKTIFGENRSIEIDEAGSRATIINYDSNKIIVLDYSVELCATIDMDHLQMQQAHVESQLSPQQKLGWSSQTGVQKGDDGFEWLDCPNLRYRFKVTHTRSPRTAQAYADFADWSSRLAAIYPPKKHPMLRMQLNEYFASNSVLPTEIRLNNLASPGTNELVARMMLVESLSAADREIIQGVDRDIKRFKAVSDREFFDVAAKQAKLQTPKAVLGR